jgi:His-Xaa-Ser system radical SAM maturase HxsC
VLLKLSGRHLRALGATSESPFLGRVCVRGDLPEPARAREILLVDEVRGPLPANFRAYFVRGDADGSSQRDIYRVTQDLDYLAHGDVVRVDPARSAVTVLYRRHANANSLLVTERCDNYCVMCTQPPKDRDDSWLVDDLMHAIPLMSPHTRELGITGGEPSLLRGRLVDLIEQIARYLPRTAVHVLSNGRSFADVELAQALAAVRHPDLMVGIPLYADVADLHDFVVQARGAFDQTVRGILNLKQHGVRVELRFVIHRETYAGMVDFARFVARNLRFVDHVALMGLELMGFARSNLDAIWIDPLDYQAELAAAVEVLARAGLRVSIYNHPLCILPEPLHRLARASISDWKSHYVDECVGCTKRERCGGLFASSSVRRSRGIAAFEGIA